MFKQVLTKGSLLKQIQSNKRFFLSDAFKLNDSWNSRLSTPILQKVNTDSLYYELEQRFQQKNKVSAIDIDIYANKLTDDSHIDEVADLMYKFRLSEETSNALESTQHALVRNYIEHNQISSLIQILNNRISYGVFLDDYTSNLLLDCLITSNDFKSAARIATLLMLQEDFSNPITRSLSIYACFRYLKPLDLDHFEDIAPAPVVVEEKGAKKKKQEEIKIRVRYLRNQFFDDHFDLDDSKLLLGKTCLYLGMDFGNNLIGNSSKLLGYTLYQKYEDGIQFVEKLEEISKEVLEITKNLLDKAENKDGDAYSNFVAAVENLERKSKLNTDDFEKKLIENVNESVAKNEQNQIEMQKKTYSEWCETRQKRLDEEFTRLQRAKRLQEIERVHKEMEEEERKLWFFENEDKLDLEIDSKIVYYPKKWFGKKKKPRVVDAGYIPPEVRAKRG